jgi:hypothetical protein
MYYLLLTHFRMPSEAVKAFKETAESRNQGLMSSL